MIEKKFRFNIYAFLIAFAVGLVYVYINVPRPKNVVKYPTPYNADKIVYKGLAGDCYKFKAEETKCTKKTYQQPIV